jgi:SAM-dependent methyltransferase
MTELTQSPSSIETVANSPTTSLPLDLTQDVKEGKVLAGDDFTEQQLARWFAQEQEAYFRYNGETNDVDTWHAYMRFINERLGFSRIPHAAVASMLVVGPGSGIEVERIAAQHPQWSLNFLEASANFATHLQGKWPHAVIVKPTVTGDIALEDDSQNLVCAFSVLHHIANVSKVMKEFYRVMSPGGVLLVREPCSSMGDWRSPRGLTPNERGIGCKLLVAIAQRAGFECHFKPVPILFALLNKNSVKVIVSALPFGLLFVIDRLISRLAALNDHYWRDTWYKRIGPSYYFYVFQKPNGHT